MGEYREYTVETTLLSSLGSEFQSDTIFGQFCWALRFLEGEDRLIDFLGLYTNRETPPLLISNAFPKNYAAKPVLPPLSQEQLQVIMGGADKAKTSFKIKAIKRLSVLPRALLKDLQRHTITPENLFAAMYLSHDDIVKDQNRKRALAVQHNTIDRIQGSVRVGGLYANEEVFFDRSAGQFEIYLKTDYFTYEELFRIFKYMGREGFGRDGSTGKGHFDFTLQEGIDLPQAERPNAFMTLSSYIPTERDPARGYYNIVHKFGKLGGLYAKGVKEVFGNPFKVPLIMFSAGSTFFDKDYNENKVYGSLVDHVHQNTDIRHYAYAFPLGINIEVQDENA